MSELKRPERYVHFESIKPELKEITEFYTRKVTDYQHCLKQLNEYADALENEISVLKETPKVEVLLDYMPKQLVVIPRLVADFIESENHSEYNREGTLLDEWIADNFDTFLEAIVNGYTVEKEQMYYLKNKNTGHILYRQPKEAGGNFIEVVATINEKYTWFTQDEIDTMHTGSYEQIAVKVDEV